MDERPLSTTKQGTAFSPSIDVGTTHHGQLCKMLLLLGYLYRGPLYSCELIHMIQKHDDMPLAKFYSLLDRLVANRCLYYEVIPTLYTGRDMRIYALTHKGYQQFSLLLHDLLVTDKPLPRGIEIAFCFLDRLPNAESLTLLQARRHLLSNQRVLALAQSAHRIVSYRLCLLDAELAWIDRRVATLLRGSGRGQL
jgi:DNA-binding PadR family transcriptional regulator